MHVNLVSFDIASVWNFQQIQIKVSRFLNGAATSEAKTGENIVHNFWPEREHRVGARFFSRHFSNIVREETVEEWDEGGGAAREASVVAGEFEVNVVGDSADGDALEIEKK